MAVTHPLVLQLRFTRFEFKRALKGLTEEDAAKQSHPMNCINWNVGHLAWQEQKFILYFGQGQLLYPKIEKLFAYGAPASTPALQEMLKIWQNITSSGNHWLETITSEKLQEFVIKTDGTKLQRTYTSLLQRMIYHY